MVDWCFPAAWQFAFVIWLVYEVGVFYTLEVTLVVDPVSLGVIWWSVIFPTWWFLAVMFPFRPVFRVGATCSMFPERTVFCTIHKASIWCLRFSSSCCRWLLRAVLLLVTDVHIATRSGLDTALLSLYFGVLEIMHSWTWNFDLSWSDRLRCICLVSSESCLPHYLYWSWKDCFSLWNRISYQLKLLAF